MDNSSLIPVINNKIGAILAQLKKNENDENRELSPVDFIVDMFDRNNADSLGEYWELTSGTGVAIRNNLCVPAAQVAGIFNQDEYRREAGGRTNHTLTTNLVAVVGDNTVNISNNNNNNNLNFFTNGQANRHTCRVIFLGGMGGTTIKTKHKRKIKKNNYKIKIKIQLDSSIKSQTARFDNPINDSVYWARFTAGALIYSQDYNFYYSHVFNGYSRPSFIIPSASASIVSDLNFAQISLSANTSSTGMDVSSENIFTSRLISTNATYSSLLPTAIVISTLQSDSSNLYVSSSNINFNVSVNTRFNVPSGYPFETSNGILSDTSELIFSIFDNELTVELDGNVIHTATSTEIVERGGIGLYLEGINMPAIFSNYGYLSGIKYIKAWHFDMPEPPDETGFGIYDAESEVQYQYIDKYHERKRENGRLVGYTYNPNA